MAYFWEGAEHLQLQSRPVPDAGAEYIRKSGHKCLELGTLIKA